MTGFKVHFEVFARKNGKAVLTLQLATEDRAHAIEQAEELLSTGRAIEVTVLKETMDLASGEFQSVTILTKGDAARPKSKAPVEDAGPLCVSPSDLYTGHARERIGRLLDSWLQRNRATPFELLHRPDLVEKLEASGIEIQHAVQKIAIPEAQAKGATVHEVIRGFQELIEQTIERILKHHRQGVFPDLAKEGFSTAVGRLSADPDGGYKLGVGVAGALKEAETWGQKVERLLDLADDAPSDAKDRALAFKVVEQPLSEILGARAGLADVLGPDLDLGGSLLALARMAATDSVDALVAADPRVRRLTPALTGPAARLANWLDGPHFQNVRASLARRVLNELLGPKRLRPKDAAAEIEVMRALAMVLTAAEGRILQADDINAAFAHRSQTLVGSDFIEGYINQGDTALQDVQALARLAENVTGAANKRQAAQWLTAHITALRFEREMRSAAEPVSSRLQALADVQRSLRRAGLNEVDAANLCDKISSVGVLVEADASIITILARAEIGLAQKLAVLLRMASGETAPAGPIALRAKAEAKKLLKTPQAREELIASPDALGKLRPLLQAAGIAA